MTSVLQRLSAPCLTVAGALLLAGASGAAAQTNTVIDPDDRPVLVVKKLYMDLSGALRPGEEARYPPMWTEYLSARTGALYGELTAIEESQGIQALGIDWFCQCGDERRFRVPVSAFQQSRSLGRAEVSVKLRFPILEVRRLTLELVYEDGWKIDDMIDERGRRFTAELEQAIKHNS